MTSTSPDAARRFARTRLAVILIGGVAGVAVGLAAVYGIGTLKRNVAGDPACGEAARMAERIRPLVKGEVAALTPATAKPVKVDHLAFRDGAGAERRLGDWGGRLVLLNLWATWCVPCREEMPALDRLQQTLGGGDFEVVAVNIDTRDPDKPKAWLQETGIRHLAYYADPSARIFQELKTLGKAFGMPTTLLVDGKGCEIASLAGPAEWAGADALALIRAALGK